MYLGLSPQSIMTSISAHLRMQNDQSEFRHTHNQGKEDKMNTFLTIKWTTSRGRDTYGYNICTVRDTKRGTRHACNGGGYDMQGTSFGNWLQDTYPERLLEIKSKAHSISDGSYRQQEGGTLYGMVYRTGNETIMLDGACGLSSMMNVAKAIGLECESVYNRKGHLEGIYISDTREA